MKFSVRNIAVGAIAGTTIVVAMKLIGMYVDIHVSGPSMAIAGVAVAWILFTALNQRKA